MQLEEPNDLLRLCYEYKIQQIPVSDGNSITGSLSKDDLVGQLSHSEGFDSDIQKLINELVEPVEEGFIDRLRAKLRNDEITGIPIVSEQGAIERTITPGVLKAEQESEEFLEQSNQLKLYEDLLKEFPFPLSIQHGEQNVFENGLINSYDVSDSDWHEETISLSDYSVHIYIPEPIKDVYDAFQTLNEGENIDLRDLLDTIEFEFLKKAHSSTDSISSAAETVGLPRQTFNYRWSNHTENSDTES